MKKLFLVPLVALAACTTVPDESAVAKAVNTAVKLENGVAIRCALGQQTPTEKIAQTAARLLFVSQYGTLMTVEQRARYDASVVRTDAACGSAT